MIFPKVLGLAFVLGATGLPVLAQETETLCRERAASKIVRIAVCTENAEDEVLFEEGERMCDGALPCGVWFYLSEEQAPTEAPSNHDGLTQQQVTDALGVYVAEQGIVIRIDQVQD